MGTKNLTPNGKASGDDDVIPDTPDAVKPAPRRTLKGRSFLSSSNFLVNPANHKMPSRPKMKAASKQQKGRNFEDAYKEMLNRQAEANGEVLEKGDVTALMVSAGMPLPIGGKQLNFQPAPGASVGMAVNQKPDSTPNDRTTGPATTGSTDSGTPSCSGEEPSPSLLTHPPSHPQTSLLHSGPASKLQLGSGDTKRKATSGMLSGIKRCSSKGESPNAKRHARHSSSSPRKPKLEEKALCKRKLQLCSSKKGKDVHGSVRSQSWDIEPSMCEDDSVLSDILNEMKGTEEAATKHPLKKPPLPRSDSLTLAKSSCVAVGQENTDIEVLATSMDTDVSEVLTGIIDELRNKTPKTKTPKPSHHRLGKKYLVKKTPKRLHKPEKRTPERCDVENGVVGSVEEGLTDSFKQMSPFKAPRAAAIHQSPTQPPTSHQPPVCASFGRHTVTEVTRSRSVTLVVEGQGHVLRDLSGYCSARERPCYNVTLSLIG